VSQMLSMTGVTVCYDNVEAVRNVSLSVDEGQIVTVIGPNGAGKTTLLMAAIGLLASRGSMVFRGSDIRKMSVEDRVERRLCLVPEKRELFSDMSVADNLLLGSYSLRDRSGVQKTLDEVYDRFPRLKERQRQAAGTLSGGERQMLALGRALMAKPALLMLDEPSLGLAPLIVREIFRTIASLRDLGVSILLVEQNARAALETADYGYVLETGENGRRDLPEAFRWYRRAAEAGSIEAAVAMGTAHYLGRGQTKDAAEAARWYREAARAGDVGAQYLLASMYEQGDGVATDLRLARYWYELAARNGDEAAPGKLREVDEKIARATGEFKERP